MKKFNFYKTKIFNMNILKVANEIVNERSQEKDRLYGDFSESMDKMKVIFNVLSGLQLETKHMYFALIALKLSRESFSHREDNLLDCCAYIGALNNFINENLENNEKK